MAWAVNVGVVAVLGFVFNVCSVDRDAARFFFWRCVNLIVRFGFAAKLLRQYCRDRCCQRGLAVVNVTDSTYVDVRLGPFKLAFCHLRLLKIL